MTWNLNCIVSRNIVTGHNGFKVVTPHNCQISNDSKSPPRNAAPGIILLECRGSDLSTVLGLMSLGTCC